MGSGTHLLRVCANLERAAMPPPGRRTSSPMTPTARRSCPHQYDLGKNIKKSYEFTKSLKIDKFKFPKVCTAAAAARLRGMVVLDHTRGPHLW